MFSSRGWGVAVGVGVWTAFVFALALLRESEPEYYPAESETALRDSLYLLWLATPVVGYLVAAVATVRRSARRFGQGMLVGLTLLMPVAAYLTYWIISNSIG